MSTKPNGADILALVIAILLPPIGFIVGLVRRGQWRNGGVQPPTILTVAVVLGVLLTVAQLLALVGIAAYIGFTAVQAQ